MAKNRQMPCFSSKAVQKPKHCLNCKRAKMVKASGEAPELGNIWCEKRRAEVNKLRNMECFE